MTRWCWGLYPDGESDMMDKSHQTEQAASDKEERAENLKPELLRSYAAIFEKPLLLRPQPEACLAAARALRFQADAMDREAEY